MSSFENLYETIVDSNKFKEHLIIIMTLLTCQAITEPSDFTNLFKKKVELVSFVLRTKGAFFYPQFWNKNGWYGMLGIIRIVCIKNARRDARSWSCLFLVRNITAKNLVLLVQ